MTKTEAIEYLEKDIKLHELFNETKHQEKAIEALNMAIEALEQEPIIHCKDCKHWQELENGTGACRRSMIWIGTDYDDYCSFAERRAEQ